MSDDPIVPMTDAEIDEVELSPNCPVCGGDGADMEDSSKDCDECRGTGLMSVYRERREKYRAPADYQTTSAKEKSK